jgi:hypothetical protein
MMQVLQSHGYISSNAVAGNPVPKGCILLLPSLAKAATLEEMLIQATILHILVYE